MKGECYFCRREADCILLWTGAPAISNKRDQWLRESKPYRFCMNCVKRNDYLGNMCCKILKQKKEQQ